MLKMPSFDVNTHPEMSVPLIHCVVDDSLSQVSSFDVNTHPEMSVPLIHCVVDDSLSQVSGTASVH